MWGTSMKILIATLLLSVSSMASANCFPSIVRIRVKLSPGKAKALKSASIPGVTADQRTAYKCRVRVFVLGVLQKYAAAPPVELASKNGSPHTTAATGALTGFVAGLGIGEGSPAGLVGATIGLGLASTHSGIGKVICANEILVANNAAINEIDFILILTC